MLVSTATCVYSIFLVGCVCVRVCVYVCVCVCVRLCWLWVCMLISQFWLLFQGRGVGGHFQISICGRIHRLQFALPSKNLCARV